MSSKSCNRNVLSQAFISRRNVFLVVFAVLGLLLFLLVVSISPAAAQSASTKMHRRGPGTSEKLKSRKRGERSSSTRNGRRSAEETENGDEVVISGQEVEGKEVVEEGGETLQGFTFGSGIFGRNRHRDEVATEYYNEQHDDHEGTYEQQHYVEKRVDTLQPWSGLSENHSSSSYHYSSQGDLGEGSSAEISHEFQHLGRGSELSDIVQPGLGDTTSFDLYSDRHHSSSSPLLKKPLFPILGEGGSGVFSPKTYIGASLPSFHRLDDRHDHHDNQYQDGHDYHDRRSSSGSRWGRKDFSLMCCVDCPLGELLCLASCVRSGCLEKHTCAAAAKGAYASFCQRECGVTGLRGFSAMALPEEACRGYCAGRVQSFCKREACRDHGCYVRECFSRAPQMCG